jgi:hypothetical protein
MSNKGSSIALEKPSDELGYGTSTRQFQEQTCYVHAIGIFIRNPQRVASSCLRIKGGLHFGSDGRLQENTRSSNERTLQCRKVHVSVFIYSARTPVQTIKMSKGVADEKSSSISRKGHGLIDRQSKCSPIEFRRMKHPGPFQKYAFRRKKISPPPPARVKDPEILRTILNFP